MTKLRPIDDRVVVLPDEVETRTPGGLVIPDIAKEKSQKGTVLFVRTPGQTLRRNGGDVDKVCPPQVFPNEVVLYPAFAGTDIEVDGRTLKVLKESEILVVVEK